MFLILNAAAGITGTFATEILPTLNNGLFFDVRYEENAVSLVVAMPGDFNADGTVDAADYAVWRKTDGSQQGYDNWRANFGATADGAAAVARSGATGSASANAAIPEPATLWLAMACIAVFLQLRHSKCAH
ncbi:MAG TPA: hypothetical protein VGK58_21365, partial [Lacipirellulaceae bacterium]